MTLALLIGSLMCGVYGVFASSGLAIFGCMVLLILTSASNYCFVKCGKGCICSIFEELSDEIEKDLK